jgi:hypothetical protein
MDNTGIAVVDGTDALAFIIVRPNHDNPDTVLVEAQANGISKDAAAFYVRHVADEWDAEHQMEQSVQSSGAGMPSEGPEDSTDE